MENFLKRMITELDDLGGKIKKAEKALTNESLHLDKTQEMLLTSQVNGMKEYQKYLNARIGYEKKLAGLDD